jgi:hypothetical protein
MHLWVLFSEDDPVGFEKATLVARDLLQDSSHWVVQVHFFTVYEVREELLPHVETIFAR